MGKAVQRWIADDGTEFESEREMILHELTLLDIKEIDLWLQQQEVSPKRLNEYRKLLRSWQQHIRNQELNTFNSVQTHDPLN